jgi:hypothetical protein
MFTKQECKKIIAKKLEEKQVISRKELIKACRTYVNNLKYFACINATVDKLLKELVSINIIAKIEKGLYKKV